MLIAKDLMTLKPLTAHSSDTIQAVVNLFTKNKLTSVPVLGNFHEVLGAVSEVSLLRSYVKAKAMGGTEQKIVFFKEAIEPLSTVKENDSILTVLQLSLKAPLHRIYVLDATGHLKGVISPKDILSALNDDVESSPTMQKELKDLREKVNKMGQVQNILEHTEHQLKSYENLVESTNFMLHSVDATGKIIMANSRMHSVLGYNPGELIGKNLHDLYPQHLWKTVDEGLHHVRKTGEQVPVYSTYMTKMKDPIKVEITSQAVTDEKGQFVATSTISRVIDSDQLLRLLNGVIK